MQNIQNEVMQNYQDNMEYIHDIDSALYNKLIALDTILSDGTYPQKYELEYKDNYFDVVDLATKETLYKQNSKNISQELTNNISLKKNDNIIECHHNYKYTEESIENIKDANAYVLHATTAPISHYYHQFINENMHMKKIEKFIFFGTGLGFHISQIVEKFGLKVMLIIEDDIELFRLSLFTCNYKKILQGRQIFFSIAQNSDEFWRTYNLFHDTAFSANQYYKFSMFSSAYATKIDTIRGFIVTGSENAYSHELLLHKNNLVIERISKKYNFLDIQKKADESFFAKKPILVVAAGPSLETNIDWLKTNQDKFVVMAALVTLKKLSLHNIIPDIVVHIDEGIAVATDIVNSFDNFDFLQESAFLCLSSVAEVLIDAFPKEHVYMLEDRTRYKSGKSSLATASVGEFMYGVALSFNPTHTYLLGLDLALSKTGATHASGHHPEEILDTQRKDDTDFSLRESILHVKGNFRDIVQTTPLLNASIPILNRNTANFKGSNQIVYNLNDGAYFENTIPLHPQECQLTQTFNKTKLHFDIIKLFDTYSSTDFDRDETHALQVRYDFIQDCYKYIADFETSAVSSEDIFLSKYITMINAIHNGNKDELRELFVVYFLTVVPIIVDFFNTKELKNQKKHIKKLKKIIVTQMMKILDTYNEALQAINTP